MCKRFCYYVFINNIQTKNVSTILDAPTSKITKSIFKWQNIYYKTIIYTSYKLGLSIGRIELGLYSTHT